MCATPERWIAEQREVRSAPEYKDYLIDIVSADDGLLYYTAKRTRYLLLVVCNRDRYTAKNSRVNKISGDLRSPSLVPQRGRASPHPSSKPLRACRDNPAPHVYVSG